MNWRVFSLTMDRLVSWLYSSSLYWMGVQVAFVAFLELALDLPGVHGARRGRTPREYAANLGFDLVVGDAYTERRGGLGDDFVFDEELKGLENVVGGVELAAQVLNSLLAYAKELHHVAASVGDVIHPDHDLAGGQDENQDVAGDYDAGDSEQHHADDRQGDAAAVDVAFRSHCLVSPVDDYGVMYRCSGLLCHGCAFGLPASVPLGRGGAVVGAEGK